MGLKKSVILFLPIVALFWISCGKLADVATSKDEPAAEQKEISAKSGEAVGDVYEKNGVKFPLPKNWKVSEDEEMGAGIRYISAEDDEYALVNLLIFPKDHKIDLMKYADDFVGNMALKIKGGKIGGIKTQNTQRKINDYDHPGIEKKYVMTLLGETVPHTAQVFLVKGNETKAIVIISAPDEDLPKAEPGFQTLFSNLRLN